MNPLGLNKKIAFIGLLNGHYASVVSFLRCIAHVGNGNSQMRAFSIVLPIDQLIEQLNAFQPDIIATYPSMAAELASHVLSGQLHIAPSDMLLGGEMLGAKSRLEIQNSFECNVRNQYGASEFLPIAWECAYGHLHANSDWVILEPVDRNYRLVEDGDMPFTTLVSNLANYVQPIYRYDIGDRVIFNRERCSCCSSFPRIEVMGRNDDVIHLINNRGEYVSLLPLALTTLIEQCGVYDFQLGQISAKKLILRLAGSHNYSIKQQKDCRAQLENYLINMGLTDISLAIEVVPYLKKSRSGKAQRICKEKTT